jgi:predicted lipoprotein with Yx(FWY)xxD motif
MSSPRILVAAAATLGLVALARPTPIAAQGATMPPGVMAQALADGRTALVDAKMMTLYTYARDTVPGKSACNGRCAENWPPLKAADDAKPMGEWTIVTRDDGAKMWAYKGKPLYTFARDTKAGDATGDNMGNGNWKVATP